MTREQIEKMEAGPEMDARVARTVMGWKFRKATPNDDWVQYHVDNWISPEAEGKPPRDMFDKPHPFSTNLVRAFEVVNKLVNDAVPTVRWELSGFHPGSGDAPVFAFELREVMDGEEVVSADGDSIPEAICRAALLTTLSENHINGG